jgi:hypothetical protein
MRIGGRGRGHRRLTRRGAVGDHPRAPGGIRREHAVVEHEIDPRPWGERREFLEQRERLEDEMTRAIRQRRLEREHEKSDGPTGASRTNQRSFQAPMTS